MPKWFICGPQRIQTPYLPFFTSCSTGGGKATSTDTWGGTVGSASGSFSSSSSLCPFSWPSAGTTYTDMRKQRRSHHTATFSSDFSSTESTGINFTHLIHCETLFSETPNSWFKTGLMKSPGCPRDPYVHQAGLEFRDLLASAFLEIKPCATMAGLNNFY